MANQFYRKLAACAIVGCSVLTLAQSKPKPRTGPRAISVLEKDAQGNTRLVPVTIWINDRYYDASQYQANPIPMVAEPGTVYEILQTNIPLAWFTTEEPRQIHGNWISAGTWQKKKGEYASSPAKVEVNMGRDGDRPVLKRHGQSGSSSTSSSDSGSSHGDGDPDRPTLKKSKTAQSDDSSASTTTQDNDADRPTLKKSKSAQSDDNSDSGSTPTIAKRSAAPVDENLAHDTNESDPDRPTLRKNTTGANLSDNDKPLSIPTGMTQAAAPKKIAPQSGTSVVEQYIAISDPQKSEYRPYKYELKPEDMPPWTAKVQKIAGPLLEKWAMGHGGVKLPPNLTFTDFDIRAFDVDYNNNPEFVFTASYTPEASVPAKKRPGVKAAPAPAPSKPVTYYLTVVARTDSNGDASAIFSQITDNTRLDAYGRLELIDAVDAEGYGRGSLLFREYNDVSKAFVLYRVDAYNLTKLFEGASGE
ncbi:hypothetical protein [Candidatus Korobacter versatilis]|nr:hypothetical protein [Candidatus Koribacter versatilis]